MFTPAIFLSTIISHTPDITITHEKKKKKKKTKKKNNEYPLERPYHAP